MKLYFANDTILIKNNTTFISKIATNILNQSVSTKPILSFFMLSSTILLEKEGMAKKLCGRLPRAAVYYDLSISENHEDMLQADASLYLHCNA